MEIHVLNFVYFPLYLRLWNILKNLIQLFTSTGTVTAQQGWHNIYRRLISMIYIRYLQRKYHIRYTSDFSLMKNRVASQLGDKPTARQPTGPHVLVKCATMPPIFYAFCACVLIWLICAEFTFVVLWQTSMNALIITETATHRRSAPTRLEASTVPVLTDILATGSRARVTNERLFYILPFSVNFSGL